MQTPTAERLVVTIDEAASKLSIHRRKEEYLLAEGALRSIAIGRCRRIAVSELRRYIATLQEDA